MPACVVRELSAADIAWDLADAGTVSTDNRDLLDLFVDTVLEAASYRLLAQQAIHQLHDRFAAIERLQARQRELIAENCELRAAIVNGNGQPR